MTDEVVYGPTKPPTSDWRWQEVLSMEPLSVMSELRDLDKNLFAARSELRESVREMAELVDVLDKATQQTLEGIRDGADQDLRDRLFKGGTKDERAQRQATYLGAFDWVKQSWAEIKAASTRRDNAQVAFDSLLDRQTNLGRFANMYAATARLLASIRPPEELAEVGHVLAKAYREPVLEDEADHLVRQVLAALETAGVEIPDTGAQTDVGIGSLPDDENWPRGRLFFIGEGKDPYSIVCKDDAERVEQRRIAAEGGYIEVDEATYTELSPYALDEGEHGAVCVVASDGVEIPASMELSPESHRAAAAAIKRHRGEAALEEEVVRAPEDLPFQPDEAISL